MWLTTSSIGRKVIMSVTGLALILFLTFHGCMNVVALFSAEGYNWVCEMLGANWYAVAATAGLGTLMLIHFVYAFILTAQNRRARGNSRYAVVDRPEKVEWASQNMLAIGIVVLLGIALHLYNFWAKMMFVELAHVGNEWLATDGYHWIEYTFSNPVYSVLYLVWLFSIWFHLTHGMWSAMHTLGASGKTWLPRIKCISYIYSTIIMLMFAAVVVKFAVAAVLNGTTHFGC